MKFLCVPCDEPMKLNRTLGPDEGSMTIVYRCPTCERETAMLTNAMETQMVRGLDIKIGGRSVPKEPMEFVKGTLVGSSLNQGDGAHTPGSGANQASAHHGGMPHPSVDHSAAHPAMEVPTSDTASGSGKCPFTHAVNEAYSQAELRGPRWTAEATARIERVPSYIRPMVRKGVEEYAKSEGLATIDASLMDDLKGRFM